MFNRIIEMLFHRNKPHLHDYEMTFPYPDRPIDWVFECKCGDKVTDMELALQKQGRKND